MKIYTKTGDGGETGLYGGTRVSKASPRVDAYGEIDELNSTLGLVRLHTLGKDGPDAFDALLATIQSRLFDLGAELANGKPSDKPLGIPLVDDTDVEAMERAIDEAMKEIEPQQHFILPGGTPMATHLHLARCTCRRVERKLVALRAELEYRPVLVRYVNRLSDLLFTLARLSNQRAGVADVPWLGRSAHKG